jgi:hypothetical protein
MGVDDDSSEHPLRLHFAIVAYKEMAASEDEWHCQLAKEIWREFLKPKTGLCAFIESKIRDKIGRTLRQFCIQSKEGQLQQQLQCGGSKQLPLPIELFDDCLPSLDHYLREQHKLFLGSYELIEYLNNSANANNDSLRFAAMMMAGDDAIIESNNNNNNIDGNQQQQQSHGNRRIFPSSRRSGSLQRHHQNHHQMEQQFNQTTTIPLTAEFLLRTQYDRETLVAEK